MDARSLEEIEAILVEEGMVRKARREARQETLTKLRAARPEERDVLRAQLPTDEDLKEPIAGVWALKETIPRDRGEEFLDHRAILRTSVEEHGFTPLAVLPKQFWDAFCLQFGLYRFETLKEDGRVEVERSRVEMLQLFGVVVRSLAVGGGSLGLLMELFPPEAVPVIGLAASLRQVTSRAALKILPDRYLIQWLWRERTDEMHRSPSDTAVVSVRFPSVTPEFTEALRAAVKLMYGTWPWYFGVAAVPEVVELDEQGELIISCSVEDDRTKPVILHRRVSVGRNFYVIILSSCGTLEDGTKAIEWVRTEGIKHAF